MTTAVEARRGRKPLLLTFDVEEFDWPAELGHPLSAAEQIRWTHEGLDCILPLLERHGVCATFFVTAAFATAATTSVATLMRAGHEVAAHGLAHEDDYGTMEPGAALDRLRRAREILEHLAGCQVMGVRTPRLRLCAADVLRQAGFVYDASPHPTWVPGRYNGLRLPRAPWWDDAVLRIPLSVLPGVRAPVSWIWFRTLGAHLGGLAVRAAGLSAPYVHLYFHPWEALDVRHAGIPRWLACRTGPRFMVLLDHLLARACSRYEPMALRQFVMTWRAAPSGHGGAPLHQGHLPIE
jgi:peptidoglycan/xylan/chitin deacetylase (PgdA/CDA1 family)